MSEATALAKTKDALDSLTPLQFALGQLLSESLPDTFAVYTLITGVPEQHADNEEKQRSYRIQVSLYSRDGLASLPDVDSAMQAQGFIAGPARQLPYDNDSRHFGLAKDYIYLE